MSATMLNNGVVDRDDPLDWPINDPVVEPVAPTVTTDICKIGSACRDLRAVLVDVMRSHPMKELMDAEISVKLNRLVQLEQALGGKLHLIAKGDTQAMLCQTRRQQLHHSRPDVDHYSRPYVELEMPAKVFNRKQQPHEGSMKNIKLPILKYCPPPSAEDPAEKWIIDHVYVLTGRNSWERDHRCTNLRVTLIRGGNTFIPAMREEIDIGKYNNSRNCTAILDGDQIDIQLMYHNSTSGEVQYYAVSCDMTEEQTKFPVKVLIV